MKLVHLLFLCSTVICSVSCKNNNTANDPAAGEPTANPVTPVTITHIVNISMTDSVALNATSSFQLKTFIKANATGYLVTVNAKLGGHINKGQEVFAIKTKESEALGNTINVLDSSFRFTGVVPIRSSGSGYVTTLNYQKGNYVQDGEQLAAISDRNSLVFLLELPYELTPYLENNKNILLRLPDGTQLNGSISSTLPNVDPASQTQSIVIKVNNSKQIPEGLIAKAILVKSRKSNLIALPKEAVLTDEMQREFWVMKLTDDSTAVKVPVTKGMEAGNFIEIISPKFSVTDDILLTGNYGLADTASVKVIRN
jgi:multidrug efflux pump subunit AcrA (membrane-fusion protein)